ncbi:MAG: YbbR-like domain-containing protein, partial [Kiritimatiellae bacterium]|nr:YbbR-like domain-containing protein [Kiritimatiellia bacterium]
MKTDREETRQVPVELATRNSLPEGYVGGAATITPASVEVTGPAGVVGNLRSVKTAELELDGRTTPVKGRKMALATGGAMSILRVTPGEVTVDMGVTEETRERVFEHLPVRVLVASGSGAAGRVEPETATVTVKGRPDALKRVTADNLQVFVDASGAGAADGKLRRAVQVY